MQEPFYNMTTGYDTCGAWTNGACVIKDHDDLCATPPAPPGNHISSLRAAGLFSGHAAPMASSNCFCLFVHPRHFFLNVLTTLPCCNSHAHGFCCLLLLIAFVFQKSFNFEAMLNLIPVRCMKNVVRNITEFLLRSSSLVHIWTHATMSSSNLLMTSRKIKNCLTQTSWSSILGCLL